MSTVIVVRPGATQFDEQGRFKGCLDLPLSPLGLQQVAKTVEEVSGLPIDRIYVAPCTAARQTGEAIARGRRVAIVEVEELRNVDHGLWHGKLIDEVRRQQPRLYRLWQDDPEQFHPPQGEAWSEARRRVARALQRLCRDGKQTLCLVVPEPLASLIEQILGKVAEFDLWKAECRCGQWTLCHTPSLQLIPTR